MPEKLPCSCRFTGISLCAAHNQDFHGSRFGHVMNDHIPIDHIAWFIESKLMQLEPGTKLTPTQMGIRNLCVEAIARWEGITQDIRPNVAGNVTGKTAK